jgi:hypothetical protein
MQDRVFGTHRRHYLVGRVDDRVLARVLLIVFEVDILAIGIDVCPVTDNLPRRAAQCSDDLRVEMQLVVCDRREPQCQVSLHPVAALLYSKESGRVT